MKGEGFVRPLDVSDPVTPPPAFHEIGEEYVRQIVDLSPGQRKRYLGELRVLARTPVRGALVFAGPVTARGVESYGRFRVIRRLCGDREPEGPLHGTGNREG